MDSIPRQKFKKQKLVDPDDYVVSLPPIKEQIPGTEIKWVVKKKKH